MRIYILILKILLIPSFAISQVEINKSNSKVSIIFSCSINRETVDKSEYNNDYNPYNETFEFTPVFSIANSINIRFSLYKNLKFSTGVNYFSEKNKVIYKNNGGWQTYDGQAIPNEYYTMSSYHYFSFPFEFGYKLKNRIIDICPFLGFNTNFLFYVKSKSDFLLDSNYSHSVSPFKSQIYIGFIAGLELSKQINKRISILLRANYLPSKKILIVDNYQTYNLHTWGIGLGIKYNLK